MPQRWLVTKVPVIVKETQINSPPTPVFSGSFDSCWNAAASRQSPFRKMEILSANNQGHGAFTPAPQPPLPPNMRGDNHQVLCFILFTQINADAAGKARLNIFMPAPFWLYVNGKFYGVSIHPNGTSLSKTLQNYGPTFLADMIAGRSATVAFDDYPIVLDKGLNTVALLFMSMNFPITPEGNILRCAVSDSLGVPRGCKGNLVSLK
jgi:hypothetical protein